MSATGRVTVPMVRAGLAGFTAIVALAFLLESAPLLAVSVTVVARLTEGAVNKPLVEMLPAVADQVTAVFAVPSTAALNCWVFPDNTFALAGETVTLMVGEAAF